MVMPTTTVGWATSSQLVKHGQSDLTGGLGEPLLPSRWKTPSRWRTRRAVPMLLRGKPTGWRSPAQATMPGQDEAASSVTMAVVRRQVDGRPWRGGEWRCWNIVNLRLCFVLQNGLPTVISVLNSGSNTNGVMVHSFRTAPLFCSPAQRVQHAFKVFRIRIAERLFLASTGHVILETSCAVSIGGRRGGSPPE